MMKCITVLADYLTGSCNTAPIGKGSQTEGGCKVRCVLNSGCHKQSSLKCTGNIPLNVGRATTEFMISDRSMRWKSLYLVCISPIKEWLWRKFMVRSDKSIHYLSYE